MFFYNLSKKSNAFLAKAFINTYQFYGLYDAVGTLLKLLALNKLAGLIYPVGTVLSSNW